MRLCPAVNARSEKRKHTAPKSQAHAKVGSERVSSEFQL